MCARPPALHTSPLWALRRVLIHLLLCACHVTLWALLSPRAVHKLFIWVKNDPCAIIQTHNTVAHLTQIAFIASHPKPNLPIDKWNLNASSVPHSSKIQSLICESVCGIYVWPYVRVSCGFINTRNWFQMSQGSVLVGLLQQFFDSVNVL